MKKIFAAALLLCASVCAYGQGATILFPPVTGPDGHGVPFVTINFCTTPTTVTNGVCNTPVTVFQNSTLSTPYSSAILTDGLGNFPPNVNTATAIWLSPAANYCYSLSGSITATNICYPFSIPVANGSSPTFAGLTVTAPGATLSSVSVSGPAALGDGLNNTVWVGTAAPYKYTSLATALSATECVAGGCQFDLISPFTQTFTSTLTLGDGVNNFQHVHGLPNASLAFNVTGGARGILLNNKSALTGEMVGDGNGNTNGGFLLSYPSTANMKCLLCSNDTSGTFNGYITLEKFFAFGNPSATITSAVLDIAGVSNQSIFSKGFIYNFGNTVGCMVRDANQANGVAGPLQINDMWCDGNHNLGAIPCTIQATFSHSVNSIDWSGGVCNHPGSASPMFVINGGGNANHAVRGVNIQGNFAENLLNGGSIAHKIVDGYAIHLSGDVANILDTDTAIDLSQTIAHGTAAVQVTSFYKASPTGAATTINNHITGHTETGAAVPFYNYGGDVGSPIVPFTIESNNVQVLDGANHVVMSIPAQSTTGVNPIFNNAADAQGNFVWKCGLTAAQTCFFQWVDRITPEWSAGSSGAHQFLVRDEVNGNFLLVASQTAGRAASGALRLGTAETVVFRNQANSGDVALGKNTNDNLTFAGNLVPYAGAASTVAGLPTCNATTQDTWRVVTDATAPTYNGTLTGGGAIRVPVYCNGTAWTSH